MMILIGFVMGMLVMSTLPQEITVYIQLITSVVLIALSIKTLVESSRQKQVQP